MGISILTLAQASSRGKKIIDNTTGQKVNVVVIGRESNGHPRYALQYPDDTRRAVSWVNGQGVPGRILDGEVLSSITTQYPNIFRFAC